MKYYSFANLALASCLVIPAVATAEGEKGSTVFSTLSVSDSNHKKQADDVGSSAETFSTPGAVSSRSADKKLQSLDNTLRGIPGTFTQLDPLQSGVSVNIRGMSGLGRVNTMVDGVTQTFYGMAPTNYHGGSNSAASVLIDPNFIAGIDITRGNSAGSQGVNALMGSAGIRTIGVDDVVQEGRQVGVLSRFSVGDNGMGRSGMVSVAGKTEEFGNGGQLGALVGMSGTTTYATYKNGAGESSKDFIGSDTDYMKQNPQSQLYKLDFSPDRYNKFEFNGRNYSNTFTRRDITSDDYSLRYKFNPLSELVGVNLLLSSSRSNQNYVPEAFWNFPSSSSTNKSNAVDLSNTSRFSLDDYDFTFLLGSKVMKTDYTRQYTQGSATDRNAFAPAGKQKIESLYTGLTINKDIYQLDLNLNYTRSKVNGRKPACSDKEKCFPQGEAELDLDDKAFNPSVMLSAQVTPWLQPFVSYSHSSRAPNVQEVFFANEGGASMNPFLKPEKAETWQLGTNVNLEGLVVEKDKLMLKALVYQTRTKDYISSETFYLCYDGSLCKDVDNSDAGFNASVYVNSLSPVQSRGYEVEANYDAGLAYLNLSYSEQYTNQPTSIASTSNLFAYDDLADLPRRYITADLGVRLLDEKLTIGSLIKYTGRSKRLDPNFWDHDDVSIARKHSMPKIPTIIDLYSSYQVTDNLQLRLTVQNVQNRDYAEALNRMNQDLSTAGEGVSVNTTARGRTWVFGGEFRF
nr:TonB-dependent receptor [uncultured Erwinia sp.]